MSAYRTNLALPPERAIVKPLRCYFGLHKPAYFTITKSHRYICVGVSVRFHCACRKYLGGAERPTNRPVTVTVGAGWDGMGSS